VVLFSTIDGIFLAFPVVSYWNDKTYLQIFVPKEMLSFFARVYVRNRFMKIPLPSLQEFSSHHCPAGVAQEPCAFRASI